MKSNRILGGLALFTVFALSLAACGGAAPSATGGTSTTASQTQSPGRPETSHLNIVYVWQPEGHETDMVATVDGGYLKKEGLDATLMVPGSPADSVKLVAANEAQIGIAHSTGVLVARAHGIPIVTIATRHQNGTNGVLVDASSNIQTLKDLEGKTVGLTGIPENRVAFEQMLKVNSVDASKVKTVEVGFSGHQQLVAGKVNALGDAIDWYEPLLVNMLKGKDPLDQSSYRFFYFYKNGLPRYYSYVIFTTEKFAKENPNTLKAFLRAWQEGMKYAQANPDAAVGMLLKRYPSVDPKFARAEWKALTPVLSSADTNSHGLGWMDGAVWQNWAKFLVDNHVIPSLDVVQGAFTNQYLPGQ